MRSRTSACTVTMLKSKYLKNPRPACSVVFGERRGFAREFDPVVPDRRGRVALVSGVIVHEAPPDEVNDPARKNEMEENPVNLATRRKGRQGLPRRQNQKRLKRVH